MPHRRTATGEAINNKQKLATKNFQRVSSTTCKLNQSVWPHSKKKIPELWSHIKICETEIGKSDHQRQPRVQVCSSASKPTSRETPKPTPATKIRTRQLTPGKSSQYRQPYRRAIEQHTRGSTKGNKKKDPRFDDHCRDATVDFLGPFPFAFARRRNANDGRRRKGTTETELQK
jgi:hypothetical protein